MSPRPLVPSLASVSSLLLLHRVTGGADSVRDSRTARAGRGTTSQTRKKKKRAGEKERERERGEWEDMASGPVYSVIHNGTTWEFYPGADLSVQLDRKSSWRFRHYMEGDTFVRLLLWAVTEASRGDRGQTRTGDYNRELVGGLSER